MKFKKLLGYLSVLVLGAAIITLVDHLIGVEFTDVGAVAQLIHTVAYILWGAALLEMRRWLND